MPHRKQVIQAGGQTVVLPGKSVDEMFLMLICAWTSAQILFGLKPPPGTLDSAMPRALVFGWALALAVGAIVVLISFMMSDRVNGMIVEQFGAMCLGAGAAVYGIIVFLSTRDEGGSVPAVFILGFAITRFLQFRSYQKTLNQVQAVRALLDEEASGH